MKKLICLGAAALLAMASMVAHAEDYPSKQLRLIVPYAPGGGTDNIVRQLAIQLGKKLNQTVIVENKPGGGTAIAASALASAPADGHTLAVFDPTTVSVAPFLYKVSPIDASLFQPITKLVDIPQGIVVPPNSPISTMKDFIAYVKANPGLAYGSPGPTSPTYLGFEEFLGLAGLKMTHTGYRGSAPAMQDLMGAQLPAAALDFPSAIENIKGGRLKAVAIATPKRLEQLPNVPTYQEEGFPGYVSMAWYGVFARAGTPRPVVDKLNRVFIEIAESKEFSDWVKSKGLFLSVTKTPEEFAAVVKSDAELYSRMIKKLDIPLQ